MYSVSLIERAKCTLFGSPSFCRANGIIRNNNISFREKLISNLKKIHSLSDSARKNNLSKNLVTSSKDINTCPIFVIKRIGGDRSTVLPKIWLSEPVFDESGTYLGRKYVDFYPNRPDPDGTYAIELAYKFFSEGTSSRSYLSRDMCIDCFRAAEILFLHALSKGNKNAAFKLGDIYQFDMCRGNYYQSNLALYAKHSQNRISGFTILSAWKYYSIAARSGRSDAYIALGDIQLKNYGNAKDEVSAFNKYMIALTLICNCDISASDFSEKRIDLKYIIEKDDCCKYDLGNALLRLAFCFERAIGCKRNIDLAQEIYTHSYELLLDSFNNGAWHCKKFLAQARKGAMRCCQEANLCEIKTVDAK